MSARQRRQGTRMCIKKEVDKIESMILGNSAVDPNQLKVSVTKLTSYQVNLPVADDAVLAETEEAKIENEIIATAQYNDEILEVISRAKVVIEASAGQIASQPAGKSQSTGESSTRTNLRLPKLELSPFSGDSLEWQSFWDRFESSVHSNTSLSTIDKYNYLDGLLTGDARNAVKGYRITAANYEPVVETLKERFGDKQMAIFAHLEAMLALPKADHDTASLQSIADQCERHIRSLVALGLDESTFGQVFTPIMLSKLPKWIKIELHRKNGQQTWSLSHLRAWLKDEIRARELGERAFGEDRNNEKPNRSDSKSDSKAKGSHQSKQHDSSSKVSTSASALVSNATDQKVSCAFCGETHFSDQCTKYPDVKTRRDQVKDRCICCLRKGHRVKECKKKVPCAHCRKQGHHRSLCYSKFGSPDQGSGKVHSEQSLNVDAKPFIPSSGTSAEMSRNKQSIMQTALATVVNEKLQHSGSARLLFDTAGSRSFITEQKCNELQLPVVGHELVSVAGFQSRKRKTQRYKTVQLSVRCLNGSSQMMTASVVPSITCPIQKVPINPEQFPSVKSVVLAEPLVSQPEFVVVDILVGLDHYYDFIAKDRMECPGGLLLLSSRLGYVATGRVASTATGPDTIAVMLLNNGPTLLEKPPHQVSIERYWDLEDIGMKEPPKQLSGDDEALSFHSETLKRNEDGRYMSRWPWKCVNPDLSDNFDVAHGRLKSLLRRLTQSPETFRAYHRVIDDQISKGVVEPAPADTVNPVYYMPHHCVITPAKTTTKLRVVYDASSKSRKDAQSLNECLHRGPVLLQDLCGLLLRFRLKAVALVNDIEKAFLQIGLQEVDRDVTRFLWVLDPNVPPEGDNLVVLRFCRVPFGVISSPFVLGNTVRQQLIREATATAMNIEKNHYVDNVATGEQSVEAAVDHYKEAKQLFQSACMNLREWYSNSKEVRESFAEADKGIDTEPKILGLRWNVDTDILHVEPVKDSSHLPTTKRNILKTIAQVFDPLGFYSPVTVEGKLLVQELWRSNHGWDDNVPKEIADKWNKVRTSLEAMPASGIPRFVGNPSRCGVELHVFCDASVKACGVAVYLLLRNEDSTSCNLMMAKTRLAPMKSPLTIPRLELVAAVIGARVLKFVADQLEVSPVEKFLWTDSQCTIHWIKRIKMSTKFVENRVSEIRQQPDIRLQYVPSEYNPADLPSRGCDMITLQNAHLWWHGPSWLSDRSKWPVFPLSSHVEVPEVIEENALVVNDATIINVIDETKFSSVNRLLRCTGYVLRFIKNLRQPGTQRQRGLLTIHELNQSQVLWHRIIQRKSFPDLIRFKGSTWPKGIGRQLNLFKDADGVLRSFGRVANTLSLSYDAKYPVLQPKTGHFTDLVVMDCHIRLLHGGPAETRSFASASVDHSRTNDR